MPSPRFAKKLLALTLAATILFISTSCGTLLYPERRGQPRGVIDPGVLLLDAVGLMRQGYALMPFRWRLKRVLRNYFEALATCEGPVLVHCLAGKDRTGLAVALLLALLEVEREHIVADFMLTNAVAANTEVALQAVRTTFGGELAEDQARELARVRPQYIGAALDAVMERHGSIAAYLREALDIPNEWLDVIRTELVGD